MQRNLHAAAMNILLVCKTIFTVDVCHIFLLVTNMYNKYIFRYIVIIIIDILKFGLDIQNEQDLFGIFHINILAKPIDMYIF